MTRRIPNTVHTAPRSQFFVRLATVSAVLNAAWEFTQCALLYDMTGWSFLKTALWMWGAVAGDVLIVLGIAYATLQLAGLQTLLPLNYKRCLSLLIVSLAAGVFLEWLARLLDLWDYAATMPTVPLLGHSVGLSPVLQMAILPALSVYLTGKAVRSDAYNSMIHSR
jgi:hypothetical protein